MRTCKICQEQFQLLPSHKGLATVCPDADCQRQANRPDPIRYVGCVAWDGKNHGAIELTKDHQYAQAFNRAQSRRGYGVVGSIVERKSGNLATIGKAKVITTNNGVTGGTKINSQTQNGMAEHYSRR